MENLLDRNSYGNNTPQNLGPDRRIILKQFSETYSVTLWTRSTSQDKVQWQAFIHHKVPYKS